MTPTRCVADKRRSGCSGCDDTRCAPLARFAVRVSRCAFRGARFAVRVSRCAFRGARFAVRVSRAGCSEQWQRAPHQGLT